MVNAKKTIDYIVFSIDKKKDMILVTGGLGYIGSHTVVTLIEKGYKVLIVDDLSNSSLNVIARIKQITAQEPLFEQIDLNDKKKIKQLFISYPSIRGIIHFAAFKAVGESVNNPLKYYRNNIDPLLNILSQIQSPISFIFSSSCTIYGQAKTLPITEETAAQRPASPYGNTKKIGEEILEDVTKSNKNLKTISLRYFNPIGADPSGLIGENPKDIPQNLVPYLTQSALGKVPELVVHGKDYPTPDGTCIRDYIHVVDLAHAHVAALEYLDRDQITLPYSVFNIGTGKGNSVLEVIESFNRVANTQLKYSFGPRRKGDIISAYASIDKALKELNWAPKYSLDQAIHSAWEWEKKNSLIS